MAKKGRKRLKSPDRVSELESYQKLHRRVRGKIKRRTKVKDYHFNSLITTNRKLADYTSIRPALKYIMSQKDNFQNIVRAMEQQNENIFTDVINNPDFVEAKTNPDKLIDIIELRMKAARNFARKRGVELSVPELIQHEFKTETYMSREERIAENLNTIFNKRKRVTVDGRKTSEYIFSDQRDFLKSELGRIKIKADNLVYLNELPSDMSRSSGSMGKGYKLFGDDGQEVILELVREQIGDTEYMTNIIIRYYEGGRWKTLR